MIVNVLIALGFVASNVLSNWYGNVQGERRIVRITARLARGATNLSNANIDYIRKGLHESHKRAEAQDRRLKDIEAKRKDIELEQKSTDKLIDEHEEKLSKEAGPADLGTILAEGIGGAGERAAAEAKAGKKTKATKAVA